MNIRTLIIDDEPHAVEVIKKYAASFPEIELVDICHNAIKAFQLLQSTRIDLLFLDVKMPGLSGTDLIRSLQDPPKVVFTTAYQEYAVEGFDLNAIDYLLKPVPFDRFLKAMDKVLSVFKGVPQAKRRAEAGSGDTTDNDRFLYLRIERRTVKINTSEVYWIESVKDYIKVVLKDRTLVSKYKISVIEKLLPLNAFIRIHRSFIVPLDKVECFHPNYVQIMGKVLPIGRNYKLECQRRFHQDE